MTATKNVKKVENVNDCESAVLPTPMVVVAMADRRSVTMTAPVTRAPIEMHNGETADSKRAYLAEAWECVQCSQLQRLH